MTGRFPDARPFPTAHADSPNRLHSPPLSLSPLPLQSRLSAELALATASQAQVTTAWRALLRLAKMQELGHEVAALQVRASRLMGDIVILLMNHLLGAFPILAHAMPPPAHRSTPPSPSLSLSLPLPLPSNACRRTTRGPACTRTPSFTVL